MISFASAAASAVALQKTKLKFETLERESYKESLFVNERNE
jgi:hypothetical protein